MPHGLSRKIRIAFIVQAAMIGLAIVLGVYLISAVLKQSLINAVLQQEATHYWDLYGASETQPPPNTYTLRGYLVPTGHSSLNLPENLRALKPGFHELKADDMLVLVDEQSPGRLYLVFQSSQAERLSFWFGTLPILSVLVAVLFVSWLTYRASKRLISPVSWLSRQVARWDPQRPDVSMLAPDKLPAEVQGEARQLAGALHGLAQRVAAHVQRERDFTRDASHELRTPLTVVRVASDMAMAEQLPPRVARSLQRIQRAGRDMEAVIDAFLLLAREAEIEPQSEEFDATMVILDEIDNARALLYGKPVELDVTCQARPMLRAPPRVLHVVISNLLRNACTYTDRGRIEVLIDSDRVEVRDTGIGMSEEALQRAFEPFYRADPSRPHGTGLGLSIVSRLCERLGWKVELESRPEQGTTATIRFA